MIDNLSFVTLGNVFARSIATVGKNYVILGLGTPCRLPPSTLEELTWVQPKMLNVSRSTINRRVADIRWSKYSEINCLIILHKLAFLDMDTRSILPYWATEFYEFNATE